VAFRQQWDVDPPRGLGDHPLCVFSTTFSGREFRKAGCSLGILFRRRPSYRSEFERACARWRRERNLLAGIGPDFVFAVLDHAEPRPLSDKLEVMVFRSRRELALAVAETRIREVMES